MADKGDWKPTADWADDPSAGQEEEKQAETSEKRGGGVGGKKAGHYVRTGAVSDIKQDWQESSFAEKKGAEGEISSKKFRNVHSEDAGETRGRGRGRRFRGRGRGRGPRHGGHEARGVREAQEAKKDSSTTSGGPVEVEKPVEEEKQVAEPYHGDITNKTRESLTIKRRRGRGRRFIENEHTIENEEFNSDDIPMDPELIPTDSHFRAESDWDSLGLPQELVTSLLENGYPHPSKVQAHCLKLLQENKQDNIIVQAPTGSGKTVAFILGTLSEIDRSNPLPQVILVAPTNELLNQLTENFQEFADVVSVRAAHVHKGEKGINAQILLMTPAVCSGLFRIKGEQKPDFSSLKFLILDEADHLLNVEDQPEFFNHMEAIIKEELPRTCRCLLFSATFSDPVMEKIEEVLENGFVEITVKREELILENIKMYYIQKQEEAGKIDLLIKILKCSVPGVTIVFSNTVRFAQTLYRILNDRGCKSALLVGKNMTADERTKTMADFMKGFYTVLITTNVLARGIDNTRVSRVINFDLPRHFSSKKVDVETYLHRIGRSGRFKRPGIAVSVVANEEELVMLRDVQAYYGETCHIEHIGTDEELQSRMQAFSDEIAKPVEEESA